MEYQTERLILREYAIDDRNDLYKLFTEEFVSTYEAHLQMKSVADVEDYIRFHLQNAASSNRTHHYFIIALRETREFLGSIGFSFVEETELSGVTGPVMELEYYLLEEHWGRGYMTEALKRILALAFEKNHALKIFAQCHVENLKSENVMIKCGMKKSAIQPKPKAYNGVFKENVRYELTADDFMRM